MRKSTATKPKFLRVLRASAVALTLGAISVGGAAFGAIGCAQSVGDIDRTQPDLVPKDAFEGQWFIRQSVVDVPATSAGAFVGEMHSLEVVVWEVQEDYLVGYRAYEKVPGAEAQAEDQSGVGYQPVEEGLGDGRDKSLFKGNPIVAFAITSHVDVQRDYNARTGEQTNVIVENTTDRPWHERDWMRVDWSENVVDNLLHKSSFMFGLSTRKEFIPENEGGADAFRMEENEDGEINYIDFTERHFVQPNMMGCLSSFRQNGIGDCTEDQIKVRTSMLKVDIQREQDYEPMPYDDRRLGEFGYFRTERPTYDRGHGNTFTGLQLLANRHEIWADNRDDQGRLKPYADRKLRPVVYHLSPGFPQELVEVAEQMAAEYDETFKRVAAAAREQTYDEVSDDVRRDTDGGTCLFCLDLNEDGEARIGDLRYNFMYWVDDNQMVGPLGYGPSSAHPESGRIVSAAAYVYGAGVDRYAQFAKDIVDGLNGKLDQDDLIGFDYVKQAVRNGLRRVDEDEAKALEVIPLDEAAAKILGPDKIAKLDHFREIGPDAALPEYAPGYEELQVRRVQGTQFESLMLPAEMETHFDPAGFFQFKLGDELTLIEDTSVPSVSEWSTKRAISELTELNSFAARNNLWLQDFTDPAIVGLAREMAKKKLDDDEMLLELKKSVFRAVMLHEVGHTVGLRHNFGGSADPLNYHDEYWDLREPTLPKASDDLTTINTWLRSNCSLRDASNDDACEAQTDGRMSEYQYSSIMDYGGRFNSDVHGLGKWDRAALASGYGNLVEVFDEDVSDKLNPQVREAIQRSNYRWSPVRSFGQGLQNAMDVHYTDLPGLLGGVDNLKDAKRKWIPRADWQNSDANGPLKVPYMSCYDEYVDAVESCHRWDHGADQYEIVADYVQRYQEYYVFNNFQRDRIGFSGFDVLVRAMDRYMLPITNMYQHWLFNAFGRSQNTPQAVLGSLATQKGFEALWQVVATPNYGLYQLDGDIYRYMTDDYGSDEIRADLRILPGEGRRSYSRFDLDSGYNVYQRVLESGHFYDQIASLMALTSFDASIVGVGSDVQADALRYSIPYYLIFDDALNRLFSAGYRRDFRQYAPRVVDGKLVYPNAFDPIDEQELADAPVVETNLTFTARLQLIIRGMALFKSNYDTEFLQMAQVVEAGAGDDHEPAPGFEVVESYNPITGRTYRAFRPEDPARHTEGWLGADVLLDLDALVQEWEATDDPDEKRSIEFSISDKARDIEMLRGLYDIFYNAVQ